MLGGDILASRAAGVRYWLGRRLVRSLARSSTGRRRRIQSQFSARERVCVRHRNPMQTYQGYLSSVSQKSQRVGMTWNRTCDVFIQPATAEQSIWKGVACLVSRQRHCTISNLIWGKPGLEGHAGAIMMHLAHLQLACQAQKRAHQTVLLSLGADGQA